MHFVSDWMFSSQQGRDLRSERENDISTTVWGRKGGRFSPPCAIALCLSPFGVQYDDHVVTSFWEV